MSNCEANKTTNSWKKQTQACITLMSPKAVSLSVDRVHTELEQEEIYIACGKDKGLGTLKL